MFKASQVMTAGTLRKHFVAIVRDLEYEPKAILITQRKRGKLVLVNAEIFEDLLYRNFKASDKDDYERAIERGVDRALQR
jgi:hypothetical protein